MRLRCVIARVRRFGGTCHNIQSSAREPTFTASFKFSWPAITTKRADEIGLCTSSRCWLETGLQSWPMQRHTRPNAHCTRFNSKHRLLFRGLQDWGPCHLTKEKFCIRAMARWRKDTREDTLSLGSTIYSNWTRAAVDIKKKITRNVLPVYTYGIALRSALTELELPWVSMQKRIRY
jgi:hypothetical protein